MTLAQCLDQYGVLPDEKGYSILKDVALALSYLHQHDPPIIHRDLSANNVLLTRGMTAKISDLGVAKMLDLGPKVMQAMTKGPGTPCYMPPEALEEEAHYNCKVDAFSYGVLMVHLFSGRWPFPTKAVIIDPQDPTRVIPQTEADRRQKTLDAIGRDHPLMNLILHCIQNNPDLRPEAVEILRTVSQLAAQLPDNKGELLQQVTSLRADIVRLQQEHALEIRSLRAESEILQLANRSLRADTGRLQQENTSLRADTERRQQENTSLRADTGRLQQENRSLRADTDRLQQETVSLRADTGRLQQENTSLRADTGRLQQENTSLRVGLQRNEAEIRSLRAQLQEAQLPNPRKSHHAQVNH